jgi:hypothetical protein
MENMMRILSFDCANKSLGYCLFDINTDEIASKYKCVGKPNVEKIHKAIQADLAGLNGAIVVQRCGVVRLFDDKVKDTTIVYRCKKLKQALDGLDLCDRADINHVVVEYQYVAGSHSREVSDCLFMYFADSNAHLFFPSARKKLQFTAELAYEGFRASYAQSYLANKAHSVANMKFIAEKLNLTRLNECLLELNVANHDDLAESFLNAYMWFVKEILTPRMRGE